MANAMQGCVREADNSFAKRTPKLEFFRDVGAPLIQKKVLSGPAVTIEWIERGGRGSVDWRYRQDRDALFYFEQGVIACHGALDGGRIDRPLDGAKKLAFIEACSTIETEVEISGRCFYWVAFIDKARLLGDEEEILRLRRLDSRIGFDNAALAAAVKALRAELIRTDELSNLYIESWAIQALVLLHRLFDEFQHQSQARLTKNEISKVVEFMEESIAKNITLECVAAPRVPATLRCATDDFNASAVQFRRISRERCSSSTDRAIFRRSSGSTSRFVQGKRHPNRGRLPATLKFARRK